MNSHVEEIGPAKVRLRVEVPFDELSGDLDRAYREIGRQVRLKGFRPGRVPRQLLDRQVGRGAVLQEAVDAALPRLYGEAVRAAELEPLGQPSVELDELADDERLVFTAELEVRPEVTVPDPSTIRVEVDDATVDESVVEEQVLAMREQQAGLREVERAVAEGDFVVLSLGAAVDGAPVEGAAADDLSYEVGSGGLVDGLDEAVVGLEAGGSATFDSEVRQGDRAGSVAQVTVTVTTVQERDLPEADDEFAVASGFDTMGELRDDLRGRVGRVRRLEQGLQARDKVLEAFAEAVQLQVPQGLVDAEVEARHEGVRRRAEQAGVEVDDQLRAEGRDPEGWDDEVRRAAEQSVRAQLGLDQLARDEQVGLEQSELVEHLLRRAQQAGVSPDQYAQLLQQQGGMQAFAVEVVRGKALAVVLEQATVVDAGGREVDLEAVSAELEGVAPGGDEPDDDGADVDGADVDVAEVDVAELGDGEVDDAEVDEAERYEARASDGASDAESADAERASDVDVVADEPAVGTSDEVDATTQVGAGVDEQAADGDLLAAEDGAGAVVSPSGAGVSAEPREDEDVADATGDEADPDRPAAGA